jgi:hypothetical protein
MYSSLMFIVGAALFVVASAVVNPVFFTVEQVRTRPCIVPSFSYVIPVSLVCRSLLVCRVPALRMSGKHLQVH